MESYSLFQLNEYIKRVIALNFREPLWIEAEIVQSRISRGHCYLELIEKDEAKKDVIAQASAAIWYNSYLFINKKTGNMLPEILSEGSAVRIKCRIDFNERYGFKLIIEDVDASYTLGKHELKKQEIIKRLQEEGLAELNKKVAIPSVIQRVAVISSEKAAGYQDFINHLRDNQYGYDYHLDLFNVAVQGTSVEKETVQAIEDIVSSSLTYDAVLLIRGGGSKLDLGVYDNYEIAKSIAESGIPFLIGIGHDIDHTVVDLISAVSLKTPTAVADYLIEHSMTFESEIMGYINSIHRHAQSYLHHHKTELNNIKSRLLSNAINQLHHEKEMANRRFEKLRSLSILLIKEEQHKIEKQLLYVDSRDPTQILIQGYAYIKQGDRNIKKRSDLKQKDSVEIYFIDGTTNAQIIN